MNKLILTLVMMVVSISVQADEMNHHDMHPSKMDHSKMDHRSMAKVMTADTAGLRALSVMPASGEAREGGYDGRYLMESTGISDDLQRRCAQASRGLIMMDNTQWSRCGGKPAGAAEAALPVDTGMKKANGHAGHQM